MQTGLFLLLLGVTDAYSVNGCSQLYDFTCVSGDCIPSTNVCDGVDDCYDESDETITQCINLRCPGYAFQCLYGGCVEEWRRCDGVEDCKDGSDEDQDLCRNTTRTGYHPTVLTTTTTTTTTPRTVTPPLTPLSGCALPPKPPGLAYLVLCRPELPPEKCRARPGAVVELFTVLNISCADGFALSNTSICYPGGLWSPAPECKKTCPGLVSHTVKLTCSYDHEERDCSLPQPPGTKVWAGCLPAFRHQPFYGTTIADDWTEARCLPDGTWSQKLYECIPDCGLRVPVKPTIADAPELARIEYPWHAALYQGKDRQYKCGGSIISERAVLTAAHCVVRDDGSFLFPMKDLQVGVGKLYRQLGDPRDAINEQRFKVSDIVPHKKYAGALNRFDNDIAVLRLSATIRLTPTVMPVCIELEEVYTFPRETVATVLGFGETEEDRLSKKLRVAKLEYIDNNHCRSRVSQAFWQYIIGDKFCVGLIKGGLLQQGDSGGGVTIPLDVYRQREAHYVFGVVSINDGGEHNISIITNVTEHRGFLRTVLRAFSRFRPGKKGLLLE